MSARMERMVNVERATSTAVRVGADIGGTFTDVVVWDGDGRLTSGKTLTVPDKPAVGVVNALAQALEKAAVSPGSVDRVIHGTTLVTNALIERKIAKTALLTTAGFRDQVEIGQEHRYDMYDLFMRQAPPLVPRQLRFGVEERVRANGTVHTPLHTESVREAARRCQRENIESVAIAFLHSYRNGIHERQAREIVREHLPHATVSISSEVDPQIREYPRISTTTVNAAVQPLVDQYLSDLESMLKDIGVEAPLLVFTSEGGICSVETARRYPVRILESGPIGGVTAARAFGEEINWPDLMAFDMGGTTAKINLTSAGETLTTHEFEAAPTHKLKRGSGIPVRAPVVDMIEIGAGGGSIARVNRLGLLSVGPESAGARPGPACYGRGGNEPTVTDADVVLGLLDPDHFLGGRMRLDARAAWDAIDQAIAKPLSLTVPEAAWSIHAVANEHMANAARVHATERGKSPSGFRLFASGGAGPVHACAVANALGMSHIVVPSGAGVASAFGFLCAPLSFSTVRTLQENLDDCSVGAVQRILDSMAEEAHSLMGEFAADRGQLAADVQCDMRYVGQMHELTVRVCAKSELDQEPESLRTRARDSFLAHYQQRYGESSDDMPIEVLNWRLQVRDVVPEMRRRAAASRGGAETRPSPGEFRQVHLKSGRSIEPRSVAVHQRNTLRPGDTITGPAIVQEDESTFYLESSFEARVDDAECIRATRKEAHRE